MLFNFFKKHEKKEKASEHFRRFQSEFNAQQKKAIMCSLFMIANSDGEYHNEEHLYLEQIASVLGYHLGSDLNKIVDEFMTINRDEIFQNLNNLSESQKDWYIITAYGMVHADNKALEEEIQYTFAFFEKMGITEQRIEDVLKKSELLFNRFG